MVSAVLIAFNNALTITPEELAAERDDFEAERARERLALGIVDPRFYHVKTIRCPKDSNEGVERNTKTE